MPKKNTGTKSTEDRLVAQSLHQIANCLAFLIINSDQLKGKGKQELASILSDLGFDRNAIAGMLQTTPESVSALLSMLRASKKGSKPKSSVDQATTAQEAN